MKKKVNDLRAEYDFSGAVRGKFYRPDAAFTFVTLEPDVSQIYKNRAQDNHQVFTQLINDDLRRAATLPPSEGLANFIRAIVADEMEKQKSASSTKRKKTV